MGKKKDWFTSSAMALNAMIAAQSVYWHQGNGLLETVVFLDVHIDYCTQYPHSWNGDLYKSTGKDGK